MEHVGQHLFGMQSGLSEAREAVEAWRPDSLLHQLMQQGLLQHATGNLYGDGQQLSRFDRMDSLSLLQKPTLSGNAVIAEALAGAETATIVDLGAGTGRQLRKLLPDVRADGLTVIAVDLEARALVTCASAVPRGAKYVPVVGNVEDSNTWDSVREAITPGSRVVVLSTFFLHHVRDAKKTYVLEQAASLKPVAVVLAEPNVDCCQNDLSDRFAAIEEFLRRVFADIDADAGDSDSIDDLKRAVFGPVLRSVLGPDNYERFEKRASWEARFKAAGLKVRQHDFREDELISLVVASTT
jgi:SAM-dependent methyltransferase